MWKSSTAGVSSLFLSVSFFSFISPAAMASKFRAQKLVVCLTQPFPAIILSEAFRTPLQRVSRAALISLTYIVRFLLSNSRPVDHY